MAKPGSKKESGKKLEILICGRICGITLHFGEKCMKKYIYITEKVSYFQ